MKFLAVLLGPSGVGIMGMYNSITGFVGAMAGMGIDTSGVRQIAMAAGTGNKERIAITNYTLQRASWYMGLLGMSLLILLSAPISRLTFGNAEHSLAVIFLSIIVLLETVMNGKIALIQGMRKIGDLAKLNILGALFGTILSIPMIYMWGYKGIVPYLIAAAIMSILTAWWYARGIRIISVKISWNAFLTEIRPLLQLGSAVMASVLMAQGALYLLRVIVARKIGIEAVGLYYASMTLSSIYVGFILSSMVKDYLPRLTAIANDHIECNKLVNEQVEIGVLMAVPGILATLTFSPIIIQIFYSAEFTAAYEILRWQVLGILLQVASWPVGFILQAKARGRLFFITNMLTNAVHVGLIWVGISFFGLVGTGMAFLGMWAFYLIMIYGVARRMTGFSWSAENYRLAIVMLPSIGIVFISGAFLADVESLILGIIITVLVTIYSIRWLVGIVSPEGFGHLLMNIKARFGIGSAEK